MCVKKFFFPIAQVTAKDVDQAAQDMAAYKRPSHVVILQPGEMPLSRVAKTDYGELKKRAEKIMMELRSHGGWDAR